ncbi:MAG: GNAT family N-acetyltransferase [Syntrophomonadaceae bacterium]
MIEVVRAGVRDRDTVLDLVERLLGELEEKRHEFARIDRRRVAGDLDAAGDRFVAFLAREDGRAIGVLTLSEHVAIYAGGRYGVIDELWVAPESRSQRVGERLVASARSYGTQRGWRRIDVAAPAGPIGERPVKFYERLGFVFTGPKLRLDLPNV